MTAPTKAEIERQIYICQRNAQEWRDVTGNPDDEEAAIWEEHAAFLARFAVPEERERIEHLQMQIGYIATELMVAGDPRSLPEIVEAAAKATSSPQKTIEPNWGDVPGTPFAAHLPHSRETK